MITLIVLLIILLLCVMGLVIVTGAIALSPGLLLFGALLAIDIIFFLGLKKLFE